jgi:hypothetical protein
MPRPPSQSQKQRDEGKTRFELRFDDDLYAAVKEAADKAEISVNQLMQGIARWAMEHAHPGEEVFDHDGHEVRSLAQPGCIWFGHDTHVVEIQMSDHPGHVEEQIVPAEVFFELDFTERNVVRRPVRRVESGGGE